MDFGELCNLVFDELPKRLNASVGLSVFARERAKFEGWLKVELCSILAKRDYDATVPEMNRIDVTFGDWAVELKTVNTNYRFADVENKHRPITNNVQGVLDDIERLRNLRVAGVNKKAVLFTVFPVERNHKGWQFHLKRITDHLGNVIRYKEFTFNNGIPGLIYIGLVS